MQLPDGLRARPYVGKADHPMMTVILAAHREAMGEPNLPTPEQFDATYSKLTDCDPQNDIAIVETDDGEVIAYGRVSFSDLSHDVRDCIVFAPTLPVHAGELLFNAMVTAEEAQLVAYAEEADDAARYRGYAAHPGQDQPATNEAKWFEQLGYEATEWGATLRRPHLEGVPDLALPDGVEIRPVEPHQLREIVAAHHECFRGEWDFREMTEADYAWIIDDPRRDETLWQVAWDGDRIVGQVKPFIDHEENEKAGHLRGFTEYISTHRDYRNRGIAGALLARSLSALKERGMTEAVLGVDTNNPGGAFQLYTKLGFELQSYEAIYTKAYEPR